MELQDFVSQSLIQITQGVISAQNELGSRGAKINPEMRALLKGSTEGCGSFGWPKDEGANPVLLVDFDVAVTAEEGKHTKGGIGVVAGVFALGSQGRSDAVNSSISHI